MLDTGYFDRRAIDVKIAFGERRRSARRIQHVPIHPERRRFTSQVRQFERVPLRVPVRISWNGKIFNCFTANISAGGISLKGQTQVDIGRRVVFTLQLSGATFLPVTYNGRVVSRSQRNGQQDEQIIGIKFCDVGDRDRDFLSSIIRHTKDPRKELARWFRNISLDMEIPSVQEFDDLNAEATAKHERYFGRSMNWIDDYCDRRFNHRVNILGRLILESGKCDDRRMRRLAADILNVSHGGLCAAAEFAIDHTNDIRIELHLFPYNDPPIVLNSRLVNTDRSPLGAMSAEIRYIYRFQFVDGDDARNRFLSPRIAQKLLDRDSLHERRNDTLVTSELVKFQNGYGEDIHAFYDHPSVLENSRDAFVLLPPSFGETKRDILALSYYLVANGFHVIRYDNTDHVGESSGDIRDTNLSKMKSDLLSAVEHVSKTFSAERICVIGSSLAARITIKAAAEDARIGLLICSVPVVDFSKTLKAVYNEDLIADSLNGRKWKTEYANVFGFEVAWSALRDSVENGFHNLESTKKDLSKIVIPTVFIAADNDPLVDFNDVREAYSAISVSKKDLIVLSNDKHRLDENPRIAKTVGNNIVRLCIKYLCNEETFIISQPPTRAISARLRLERERQRALEQNRGTRGEKEFWSTYISRFNYLVNVHDYWKYLAFLYELFGGVEKGEKFLDAGCGNGSFGAYMTVESIFKGGQATNNDLKRYDYIGVDFIRASLLQARSVHMKIKSETPKALKYRDNSLHFYIAADLGRHLVFKSDFFDKICCNWVLSYLPNPLETFRELVRVLKPGGKIIVTSLKPRADLTTVYRNFVQSTKNEVEIEGVRSILNNAGAIKCKEANGQYIFFSEKELKTMASIAGTTNIKLYRGFADQVNIVTAEKRLENSRA